MSRVFLLLLICAAFLSCALQASAESPYWTELRRVLSARYGPSASAAEFAKKAQLAHYEDVRAQFESYATHWSNRKMLVHWMMNNPWPSIFGHLFDDYFKQGGGYFGAKRALRPINVVWDYYATGDRKTAKVYVVNESQESINNVRARVAFYSLAGERKFIRGKQRTQFGTRQFDGGFISGACFTGSGLPGSLRAARPCRPTAGG